MRTISTIVRCAPAAPRATTCATARSRRARPLPCAVSKKLALDLRKHVHSIGFITASDLAAATAAPGPGDFNVPVPPGGMSQSDEEPHGDEPSSGSDSSSGSASEGAALDVPPAPVKAKPAPE